MKMLITLLLLPAVAVAQDTTLSWQGRLTDANGEPLNGSHALTFTLQDDQGGELWSRQYTTTLADGYVSVTFGGPDGSSPARDLDPAWLLDETWLALAVDGQPLGVAQPIASTARSAATVGAVQLTSAPDCTADTEGALRWQGSALQACNGTTWAGTSGGGGSVGGASGDGSSSALAGHSCKTIHDTYGASADQTYWIDPDGDGGYEPFRVYCNMTAGGWTRIMRITGGNAQLTGAARNAFWQAGANLSGHATSPFTKLESGDFGFTGWDRIRALTRDGVDMHVTGTNQLGTTVDETYTLYNFDVRPYDGFTDVGGMPDGGRWTAAALADVNQRTDWGVCGISTASSAHVGFGICTDGLESATPDGNVVQVWHYNNWSSCLNISMGEPGSAGNYTYTCNRGTASIVIEVM